MKTVVKNGIKRLFSRFRIYQALAGGVQYYRSSHEGFHTAKDFLHYGNNVRIEAGVSIAAPERLYIGDHTGICQGCYINAVGGCHIGRGCQIASGAIILTTEHAHAGADMLPHGLIRYIKPVFIEDYVWIGTRVSIAPGVRIGEGAIVAMGSVVMQDVPPLAIVMGNPAKPVMYRSKEEFESLKNAGAVVDPFAHLPILRVPPVTRRKFADELREFGFDLAVADEFHYEKGKPLELRPKSMKRDAPDNEIQ